MKVAKKKRAAATPLTVVASGDAAKGEATGQVIEQGIERALGVAASDAVAAAPAATEPTVALGSNCTVKDAVALKQALCAVVDAPGAVTLDVRGLERIDTAAVQVLCAFVYQRATAARAINWLGASEVLREAARLLGVQPLLSLPAEVAQ